MVHVEQHYLIIIKWSRKQIFFLCKDSFFGGWGLNQATKRSSWTNRNHCMCKDIFNEEEKTSVKSRLSAAFFTGCCKTAIRYFLMVPKTVKLYYDLFFYIPFFSESLCMFERKESLHNDNSINLKCD